MRIKITTISDTSSSPSDPYPSPNLLPPVCPPHAPPPPPPPTEKNGQMGKPIKKEETQKKVPKPTGPLKSLNWVKISEEKAKGTAWEFIEDEKLYRQLDLTDIADTFASSSSHKDDDTDTASNTISRKNREAQITVIDPRRYQNCTIMLSKLKLTHKEIKCALLGMDEKGKLPKDMIEQMLKFVPTKEEILLINEAVNKFKTPTVLALADRYLYEMAQISRFEHRLRCLYIIRSFKERVDYLIPNIQSVIKASAALSSNKRFKQYLSLVLAIGNYLNYGKRNGNAFGFDLHSLNRLVDVKNSHRADRNLMHYIVQLIERKMPDLTKMNRELAAVHEAARFNRGEVMAEIRSLEQAITTVRTEMTFMESSKKEDLPEHIWEENKKDRFISHARHFICSATADYNSLEKLFSEMKSKVIIYKL
uniref:FH2 domain-containing protein n=1 Tax=Heterorhabditis bacteriophora TaxID=37862 RepID=A0A1I7XMC7_HETBA